MSLYLYFKYYLPKRQAKGFKYRSQLANEEYTIIENRCDFYIFTRNS